MTKIQTMSAFGDLLGQLLARCHFTVRSFGSSVKYGKTSVNGVVLGTRPPPLESLELWCDTLNLAGDERQRFIDLAALAHLPADVRPKFETWYEEHQQLKSDYADLLNQVRRVADK